ncbi:MAG: InlB B-repeat-containing protein [Chloracidobacterium sp.]|nr:InlB B-repeat-containing protein [Chloracidobacterium sp.]
MKNRSITFRLVTFTLITAFVALAAITATASSETRFAFIDQVREFIGYAPTSQSVTTAPTELNSAEPMFFAGELLQWNTFGNAGTETTEPSILNDANIAATNLTQGTITAAGNANRFGGSNWWNTGNSASNTIAEAVAGNDYIQFVVTPNAGFSFTPTSFVFNWDKSGTGPQNVALRSSADGFASNLGTVAPTASIATANTITISGLNNLTTATTFRLYGYGATATTGTGGFDIGTNVPNVTLFGTTAAVAVDHTVTFDANGGTGSMSPQVASTATNLTSNGFTRTGYTFAGWNTLAGGGGTSYANTASYDFSADLTLYAQWTVSTYTITATSGANGTVTPAGTTVVNYGDNLTYTMTADPGYEVDVLTVDGSPVPAATTYPYINVSADHTINATYKLKDVIISSATGMPGGTYGNVTINSCDTVSLGGDVVIVGTMTVASCQGLDTNGHIVSGSGAFTLGAGGTLVVSDPGGISASGATGSIQVLGTRTFPTTAFYRFFGDVNGIVGNGLPTTVAGLTIECNACTVTGNNVASPGQVVTGTLNIISGNYVGHSDYNDVVIEAAGTLTLTDATTVSGNWTNNGGTLAGNFTVTFDGGGAQSVTGSTSFYGLAFAPGARTITFQAGSTQTATNSFAANGTSGNLITMVSSSSPTQWSISAPATAVSYLDVKDSNATSGLITATHSVNAAPGTTNTNWLFNYTLSYDGNGNSGGTAPTSVTQAASSTTTVSGAGSLVKNSDHFVRWNTAANGSGSDFNAGSTFTFTGDTTLYAQWLAACPAGKYFNGTGCVDASPGYYVPTSGQTEQTLCAAGTYQPDGGSVGCNDADAGYYVATEGSETQTKCEVGKYQDLTGQSSCKNATPGHFVSTTGAITQTDTPAGTSIPGSNATAAGAQCIAGTYQDLPGQASCKPADVNYYVPAAGATEQLPCPVGTSSAGAATQCTLNNYTVTYDGNSPSSGTAPTSPGSGDYNTTIVLPGAGDLLKTGYSFGGWNTLANGTGTNYAAGANYTIPATNSTLYAKWNATTFTLTATTGGNGNFKFGNVLANGATTVNPGESRTYRIVPDFGYQVADVLVDSVSVGKGQSYTFTNVQADHTISATFEAVTNRTLTAGTLNSYYDAVIDVPITVSDTTGANITSFDFSLSYDETKLEPVISSGTNVTITNGTLGTWSGNVVKAATGIINVSRFSASTPASGAGVLIYIKMHVKAHATTTAALTLDGTYLGGSYGAFAPFNGGAVGANAAVAGVVNINPTATTTSVVTSGTPSTYGNSVTFTATVTTGGTPAVSGGSVTFYDGGTCGTPGTALGAAVNIDVNGVAAISTAALFAGNHTIVACYGGTSDFTASSGSVAQVVNKRAVTVTAVADTKTYDGNTSSAGVPTISPALISGDTSSFIQTYDTRNAGTGKTLTPSGTISDGNSGNNYDITFTPVTTGVINKLAVTVTAVTDTKTYDGSTSSAGVPTVSPAVISPDSGTFVQTFDTRDAGTGKTLTPSGSIDDGNSGNNYTITFTGVNTGVINKLAVTVTAVAATKTLRRRH